jgi:hypothetical protein
VSPIDLNLVQSTLQNGQARYDENRKIVENLVQDLFNNVYNTSRSGEEEYYAELFYKEIQKTQIFRNIDFSKSNQTKTAIKVIKEVFIDFKKKYYN